MRRTVPVKNFLIGPGEPLAIVSGPCVIEDESHTLKCAYALKEMVSKLRLNLIFKASYDKANRSAIHSFRGPGPQEGLRILERVRSECDLPVLTDIHTPEEAVAAGQVCDLVQVPAFLCRQTDLLLAAGNTGRVVHVKKGQFMAPWDMGNVAEKIASTGNDKIILVDRGTCFGYNTLVSDMRGIPEMQKFGYPVTFDASHSVQAPGGLGSSSGGDRRFVPTLARAAVAAGCDCIFFESHNDPANAKSDAPIVLDHQDIPSLLRLLERLYDAVQV